MLAKFIIQSGRVSSGLFNKLMHGLAGSIFHGETIEEKIDLNNTRGVSIRIEKLNKFYGEHHLLKDIDLFIDAGETFAIIGPSGTGKSVLLKPNSKTGDPRQRNWTR